MCQRTADNAGILARYGEDSRAVHPSPSVGFRVTAVLSHGDRVLRHSTGDYVFLGRVDDQIKVLGHRVEPGEIEAVLRGQEGVEQAVALGWPVIAGSAQGIVAFVSGVGSEVDRLAENARSMLPPYAVPSRIYVIAEMPLNANGKVDRRALRDRLAAMADSAPSLERV